MTEIYIPDGAEESEGLRRTTHLAVSAHQDDTEIMAYPGILDCYGKPDNYFSAIVTADGAGSPRRGDYASMSDGEMAAVRITEQKRAADVGKYSSLVLLGRPSCEIRNPSLSGITDEYVRLLLVMRPRVVYTHALTDRHDTHVAVALRLIAALRRLPADKRPSVLYGCEVWRDLDWLTGKERVAFDVSARPGLARALLTVYDSQIAGGKRYDTAALGRRAAHATFSESHACDGASALSLAMDMTPLMSGGDPAEYASAAVMRFADDVCDRIRRLL